MNKTEFKALLAKLDACETASVWSDGKTLSQVWRSCERGDWLLWLCGKMADKPGWPTRKQVILAACDCAETALKYVLEGELRPAECLRVVRAWAVGQAAMEDVRTARQAAAAYADATYAYADAAVHAAAAYAAYSAYSYDDVSTYAAADAAYYAAYAAGGAAARKRILKQCANIVRKTLFVPKAGK